MKTFETWVAMNGQFGTQCGDRSEVKVVQARNHADAFEVAFGFVPRAAQDRLGRKNGRWSPVPGHGYLQVGPDGKCWSAKVHFVREV